MKELIKGMMLTVSLLGVFGVLTIACHQNDSKQYAKMSADYWQQRFDKSSFIKDDKYNFCYLIVPGYPTDLVVHVPCTPEVNNNIKIHINTQR